jgi:hypothetical protein
MNSSVRSMNSFCRPLRFLGLRQDIDVPAGELRGEPHVLTAPPDRERKLLVGDYHLDPLRLLVEHDLDDLGRLKRVHDEGRAVVGPRDDVDLLALKLAHHRLNARAAHADAGAHGVDGGIARGHGDLRPRARIARHRLHFDDAVVDLRHLGGEELRHELRVGAGQEDLRPARLATHVEQVRADAVTRSEGLARDELVAAHDAFAAAREIDDDVAVLDPLNEAVDDLADAVLVLVVLALALGVAHLLHDDLLCRLRRDAAEIERGERFRDGVADLSGRVSARASTSAISVESFST